MGNGLNFAHYPGSVTEVIAIEPEPGLRAAAREAAARTAVKVTFRDGTAADRSALWPRLAGGCHPARDTGAAIEAAGFEVEESERFGFKASALEPKVPHILGVARRV